MATTKPKTPKPVGPETTFTTTTEPSTTVTAVVLTEPENGYQPVQQRPLDFNAGAEALAMLSDEEFNERLEILKKGRDRIAQIQHDLLEKDVDYGLIPGTPKPTLFKPGAEKLALIYRLAARMEVEFTPGDGQVQPPLRYVVACYLHHGSFDGPVVAVGHGTANSWEKRYRRESNKACPDCGKTTIIKSKFDPGWYCFEKKGGCGHKFAKDDPRIVEQGTDSKGDPVEANDLQNTLLKMAEKRAFVDAVLRATASSSLFTQDVSEEPIDEIVTTVGGAVVNTDGEIVERKQDTTPDPEIRSEPIEGVQRGGHTDKATQAQVDDVKRRSKALKLGPHKLADEMADVMGGGIDSTVLPEDLKEAAAEVLTFLEGLSSGDIGRVITALRLLEEAS